MTTTVQDIDFSVNLLKALLWQDNSAAKIESLLQQKQDWYSINQEQFWSDWVKNVFDLRTANQFGLAVWAIILGMPTSAVIQPINKPNFGFATSSFVTPYQVSYAAEQPVTLAAATSMRRVNWQGDHPLYATARRNNSVSIPNFSSYNGTTIAAGPAAPDGVGNFSLVTYQVAAGGNLYYLPTTNTPSAPQTYTQIVKAGTSGMFVMGNDKLTVPALATFNLFNGTVVSTTGGATAKITPLLNAPGVYECSMTFNEPATGGPGDSFVTYVLDRPGTVYQYASMAENASVTGTYIPTTTAPVTVTDYTLAANGALTFATNPVNGKDRIYWSGTYKTAAGATVTAINRSIARTIAPQANTNFNHATFGQKYAQTAGLTIDQIRILLQLRYQKLVCRPTVPKINRMLKTLLGDQIKMYVLDAGDMSFITYVFATYPSSDLAFVLQNFDVLPRPAAVGIKFIVGTRATFGFGPHNKNFNHGTFGS